MHLKIIIKTKNGHVDAGDYIQGKGEGPNPAGVPEYDKKVILLGHI